MQCVENCDSPDPSKRRSFEQPVWQTAQMFVGEMGCWLIVAGSAIWTRLSSKSHTQYQPLDSARHTVADGSTNDDDEVQPGADPAKGVCVG